MSGESLLAALDGLLDLIKIEANEFSLELGTVSLDPLIEEVHHYGRELAKGKALNLFAPMKHET